jgi:hypothetical protein
MDKGFAGFFVSTRRNTEKHEKTRKTPIFWHQIGTKLAPDWQRVTKKTPPCVGA